MEDKEDIQQILDYLDDIIKNNTKIEEEQSDTLLSLSTMGELVAIGDTSGLTWNKSHNEWECISFYAIDTPEPAVKINFGTGEVQLSEWMTPDSAAKLFWDRVIELNPLKIYDPQLSVFECTFPHTGQGRRTLVETLPEGPDLKTPEETALDAYTRAMKVIR